MKQEQCLTGDLRIEAIKDGIDVEALDREFTQIGFDFKKAKKNVFKQHSVFWRIKYYLSDFMFPRFGYINPEIEEEYERIHLRKKSQ